MTLIASNPQIDGPEAAQYNRTRRWLEFADMALGAGFLIVLLVTGWSGKLRDLSFLLAKNYALRLFFFVFFLSVIHKVLSVGLDFYGFRLEHHYALSNQKLRSWILDSLKAWLLGLVVATVLAEIVYGLIGLDQSRWWLYAWVIFVAIFVMMAQLAPLVIFPLFYKFSPLQDEELKARLVRLGERTGTRVRGVYEWKLSEKSKKANAALTGLGKTRRIILADTLLQNYTKDEIEAVLAHELGHHVKGHFMKGIFVQAAVTFVGFWVANEALQFFINQRHMFRNIQHLTDFANLPLLVLVSTVISILLMPALNAYSRFNERQADLFCWKSIPSVEPYVSAMKKLNRQNLGESNPSRLVEVLFHSHPPVSRRIAAAQDWAKKHQPSLAS